MLVHHLLTQQLKCAMFTQVSVTPLEEWCTIHSEDIHSFCVLVMMVYSAVYHVSLKCPLKLGQKCQSI